MKTRTLLRFLNFYLLPFAFCLSALAQGTTAFTYQGRLNVGAAAANGLYDFQFTVYNDSQDPGSFVTGTNTMIGVGVTNGLFTVTPDFGAIFDGRELWLGIAVRPNGGGAFTLLSPFQPLTPVPYALFSDQAFRATQADFLMGKLPASQITGTIASSNIGVGTITSSNLAPGAAAANLAVGGGAAVPSSGIVLSEREVNQKLLDAGFAPLGTSLTGPGESWTVLSNGPPATGALSAGRYGHKVVWTGTEMLIIGGTPDKTGLRYNPTANTWIVLNKSNAPAIGDDVLVAWSGSQLLVWDAYHRVGGRYNPTTDTWLAMSDTNAPSARVDSSAAFANGYLVVWGGSAPGDNFSFLNSGGRYNTTNNTWTATSLLNAPQGRAAPTAVWSGTEVIFYGGKTNYSFVQSTPIKASFSGSTGLGSGGRYNPATDTWAPVAASSPRFNHTAVWTGSRMLVYGGFDHDGYASLIGSLFPKTSRDVQDPSVEGAAYNPANNSWTTLGTAGAPANRANHVAVWDGTDLLVWGGETTNHLVSDGASYTPASDNWTILPAVGSAARIGHAAVWTGTQMVLWGGKDSSGSQLSDGLRYTLAGNTWSTTTPPPSSGEPSERSSTASIWTGDALIVWGGATSNIVLRTGGIYRPGAGWTNTPEAGAPSARSGAAAIWTGTEMIVWGGQAGSYLPLNTGARFNVSSNRWYPMTTLNAPRARVGHAAVWTGTEMIIFGGSDFTNVFYPTFLGTGGAYNPATDTWREIPQNAFMTGAGQSAVWSGKEMIIWGGYTTSGGIVPTYTFNNLGFRYDPATNQWTAIIAASPLSPRYQQTAVWTGSEMLVWGGRDSTSLTNSGARYNPVTDTWSTISTTNAPSARTAHVAVWADGPGQMIVWGGFDGASYLTSGALYDPFVDKWTTMTNNAMPLGRYAEVAAWTGSQMLIFAGANSSTTISDGKAFTPRKTYYLYQKP